MQFLKLPRSEVGGGYMLKWLWPFALAITLAGCAKSLSDAEIKKLEGGQTNVVVYGFCVPMDHLIKTTIARAGVTIKADGRQVGRMKTCGHTRFRMASGYKQLAFHFDNSLLDIPSTTRPLAFKPGNTNYIYMKPGGNGTWFAREVSKAEAERAIAEIKQIGQMF
jgi:hypothetical protein